MNPQSDHDDGVWLVYDGECPVCRHYCRYVRLRKACGRLHLVDARQPGPLMDEITRAGLDIDQGMVVKIGATLYYGSDAVHVLTLLSSDSGWFNRINHLIFSRRRLARIAYPVGKAVRNRVLKVLGVNYIDNLGRQRGGPDLAG